MSANTATRGTVSLEQWDRARDRGTARGHIVRLWDHDRNEDTPSDVSYGSGKRRWWRCPFGHSWSATVNSLTSQAARRGTTGCPFCDHKAVSLGETDLATTHPDLAGEWHRTRNGKLKPTDLVAGSHLQVWWRCRECGHAWSAQVLTRAIAGSGCPACASRVVVPGHSLADTIRIRRGEWSARNEFGPKQLLPNSNQLVWRVCLRCGEEWQQRVESWAKGFGHGCGAATESATRARRTTGRSGGAPLSG